MECTLAMEKHFYFVRHGQSNSNADGVMRGSAAELNETGHEQAQVVAERLARIGVEALIVSPYERTRDTARYAAEKLGLIAEESALFTEYRGPSGRIGQHRDTPGVKDLSTEIFDGYLIPGHRHSDEENFDDLKERSLAGLAFLVAHPQSKVAVVTHGLFMRILFCAALFGEDFTGREMRNCMRALEMNNTGISHFVYKDDPFEQDKPRWYVRNWNDSSHLG
jgi:broad specificity phosphatase PhoE